MRATLILASLAGITLFTSCLRDPSWTVSAVPAAGLQSPFTANCPIIADETKVPILLSGTTMSRYLTRANPNSMTFYCTDVQHNITGTTIISTVTRDLTASSSEGSTEADAYAKRPDVTVSGIFPIIK